MEPKPPTGSEPVRPDLGQTDDAGVTTAPSSASTKRRTALIAAAAVVVALGATGAAAVRLMAGSDAKLLERVPASADLAFTVYLDPAAGQKMNLMRMVGEFPDLGGEQKLRGEVNDVLDESLAELGLTHEDLEWVGSQVTGFVDFEHGIDEPQGAVLVAVDDEEGARAAMDALVETSEDRGERVTIEDHDGVEVIISGAGSGGAVALVDGVMILASGEGVIDDVMGTEAGDSLATSPTYTETIAELPRDHLAVGFVDVPGVMESMEQAMALSGVTPEQMNIQGFEGAAASLSAEPDGFAIDAFMSVDASQLSDEQRELLGSDHTNALIDLVSADAFGFAAQTGLHAGLEQTFEDLAAQDPTAAAELERLGVTGPGGLTSILGPDVAVQVTRGTTLPVGGAFMVTTIDPEAMRTLMDRWARQLGGVLPGGGTWAEAEHAGVSFAYLEGPAEVPVAYGVVDDVAVIAASPDEMIQIIERSQGGGNSIADDPAYLDASAAVPHDDGIFFFNVAAFMGFVAERMGPQAATELEAVEPITTVTAGSSSDLEGSRVRIFVEIP